MRDIIQKYVGKEIGCNHREANILRTVILAGVTDTHFTLKENESVIHFPFATIVYMAESPSGISVVGGTFSRPEVPFVIQIRPLVVGSVGIGVGGIF